MTLFSDEHEYIKVDGKIGTVGITNFAQKALGDVVYVEQPAVGAQVRKGGQIGVVESVKSASEIYSPVSGEIVEVNDALTGDPALVNKDPQGGAWMFRIKISNDDELKELKDENAYNAYVQGL